MSGPVIHRSLDGGMVSFEGDSLDLSHPASSFILSAGQEFGSGPRPWGRELASHLGIATFDEQYGYQDGVLFLAHGVQDGLDGDPTHFVFAVWEGKDFSIKSPFYPRRESLGGARLPTSAEVIATWELFFISETSVGASLLPTASEITPVVSSGPYAPDVVKVVPGVGRLDVLRMTPGLREQLPTSSGLGLAGGDLYVEDDERRLLVLVGESAFTTIYSEPETTDSMVLNHLESLVVGWTESVPSQT